MAPTEEGDGAAAGAAAAAFERGQQALRAGDLPCAIEHLESSLRCDGGETIDTHLLLAEALWQSSQGAGTEKALPHYEAAASLARSSGDSTKEGMVALGHGFALSQLGRAAEARERLTYAKELAQADGNEPAVQFLDKMLSQAAEPPAAGADAVRRTWRQFSETVAAGKPAVLFARGGLAAPADAEALRGAKLLRAAGCSKLEVVDVLEPGPSVPDGLQGLADSPHLAFPQLFVAGGELEAWLEVPAAELRERLAAAGVPLGEPGSDEPEPCHGTSAFAEGLEPWEVALVELVSKDGASDWAAKAACLKEKGFGGEQGGPEPEAALLEAAWERLAPVVREKLEKQPEMPCGHSCSTCPTRHDCQLHDAVGHVRDIEDLAPKGG
uniref:Uncharacterized protein n=1 Tax=Alexandrium catenella TaxID=2925 RepID=A0A7S1L771_ALECA